MALRHQMSMTLAREALVLALARLWAMAQRVQQVAA